MKINTDPMNIPLFSRVIHSVGNELLIVLLAS